jgi:acetyl-CoA carboxylase biotin carboxyl carrier protein
MQLDHDQLHRLLQRLAESDIQEFRLEGDDFRLEVRRNLPAAAPAPQPLPVTMHGQPHPGTPGVAVPASESTVTAPAPASPPPAAAGARSDLVTLTAPMVGTFYRSSAPGEPPFVEVGTRIQLGQTVCIVEAMKLMNELEAETAGEVVEILVENGTPVEFGQALMRIRPS